MMTPMILLLLLSTMLASAHERPQCTAKDMEGLQIVGYSLYRVFRYTDYTKMILLDKHTFSSKDGDRSYLSTNEFGDLAHLHQGFNDKLIVLQYGDYEFDERDVNINGVVKDRKVLHLTDRASLDSLTMLTVLNITSIDPKERLDSKESGFERPYKESSAAYDFASFVYEDRLYYEGGYTNTDRGGSRKYKFVPKGRDLCKGMKFPVVDIAFTPPFCHSRLLNESADAVDPEDDEWIVSLVNGIRTTRSRHCEGWTDFSRQRNVGGGGVVMLPDVENFCFYLLTPQMKEPCLFAVGNRHVFQEVQVAPVEPVRMAVISTTTIAPTTTTPADSTEDNSDGKVKSSGTKSICGLLCVFFLLLVLSVMS